MLVNTVLENYVGRVNTLSSYVQKRRAVLGLTQAELAARCDLSRDFIAQVESGKSKLPVPENRRKLASGLGVSHIDVLVAAGEIDRDEITALGVTGTVVQLTGKELLKALIDRMTMSPERQDFLEKLLGSYGSYDAGALDRVEESHRASNDAGVV